VRPDGEELSQDRQKAAPENRREGQTLPLRQVPQAQPEPVKTLAPWYCPNCVNQKEALASEQGE
jgi:hypothetical protein